MPDPTGPTTEAYEVATTAIHDVDCPETTDCLATPTSWARYARTAAAAVDAVWPLAVAQGRRQAAEAIRAYVAAVAVLAEDAHPGWIDRLMRRVTQPTIVATLDVAVSVAEGTDRE